MFVHTNRLFLAITYQTVLVIIVSAGNPVFAQRAVKIDLFYLEPQLDKIAHPDEPDSITIYVKEPFQPVREYADADLGYSTTFEIMVGEYCPVEVCKNNQCFYIFIDSDYLQISIDSQNFRQSKAVNSPLSLRYTSILSEILDLSDKRSDSFVSLMDNRSDSGGVSSMFEHYNNLISQFIRKQVVQNSDNAVGWTLLIRNPEGFTDLEIFQMSDRFNAVLRCPSTELIRDRLMKYRNQLTPPKTIYELFQSF